MDNARVVIYSDGGCKPNPGVGGWAAILICGTVEKELYGYEDATTNNRMELTAAVRALSALTRRCEVEFHTDSQYMRKGITEWMKNWKRNGWRTANKKPVENQDLWQALDALTEQHDVRWEWVPAHAGNKYNERVDQLATMAREERKSSSLIVSCGASS
jgi:ribonuclease HI